MESRGKDKIIVILGPTSSGKSEVAIRLASAIGGEIISADSRQIYKGMDIGTGKVSGAWKVKRGEFISEKIPHYLIDIVSPKTDYNAATFKEDANYLINYVIKKGKIPIICGGTGFWIKALVDNVNFPEVKPNRDLRKRLEKETVKKLFKMLQKLDLERANNIDAKNKVRLIRAIEIAKALGFVPRYKILNTKYKYLQIGIDVPKKELHKNIKKRLEKRFKAGMIAEVKKLHEQGLSWKKIQSFGLAYYWIPLYLQKKSLPINNRITKHCDRNKSLYGNFPLTKEELFEKVFQAEKNYSKRQMTWFKKDKRIIWLKNYKKIEREVKNFLNK